MLPSFVHFPKTVFASKINKSLFSQIPGEGQKSNPNPQVPLGTGILSGYLEDKPQFWKLVFICCQTPPSSQGKHQDLPSSTLEQKRIGNK